MPKIIVSEGLLREALELVEGLPHDLKSLYKQTLDDPVLRSTAERLRALNQEIVGLIEALLSPKDPSKKFRIGDPVLYGNRKRPGLIVREYTIPGPTCAVTKFTIRFTDDLRPATESHVRPSEVRLVERQQPQAQRKKEVKK